MNQVILIKYGELTTKKGNRNFFIKTLTNNIEHKLNNFNIKIVKDLSRMLIFFNDNDFSQINAILKNIFGIYTYHLAYITNTNIEDISQKILEVLSTKTFDTFKVEVKRSDKSFPYDSPTFAKNIGALILKNIKNIKVDVHNPQLLLKVEITSKNTYIYTDTFKGSGGYPVGSQPRALLMLSGGIDSPVAGYLALKRGVKLDCVYFEAIPHTSLNARQKVITLTKKLINYTDTINLHIVNFTHLQEEIYKNCHQDYVITIMRRMMYRIMEKLAKKYKAYAIVNGESIGQVASQTLVSMQVINKVTSLPIIRPVACLDKLEIIDIAKKIDTYETSILPYEDCCTIFVPKHPVINPNLKLCEEMEKNFDYETIIANIIENINTIKIRDIEDINELL